MNRQDYPEFWRVKGRKEMKEEVLKLIDKCKAVGDLEEGIPHLIDKEELKKEIEG